VPGRLDFALIARLREVAGDTPATEAELRALTEQAEGWGRALTGQIEACERRLRERSANAEGSLAELADELRRLEELHPQLEEVRTLRAALDRRARSLRTAWLLHQAESSRSVSNSGA
jgi:chromosome segregation ATPase